MCLPISSKRSTQTTNTFVSGPSGGKDFPVDERFVFTKGLSYRNSTIHSEFKQTLHKKIRNHNNCCQHTVQIRSHKPRFTFLADSRFSEWLGNSSSVRLGCLFKPGMMSVLVSASTVESLCTDDSSGRHKEQMATLSTLNPSLGFHHIQYPSIHIQGREC